jgi:hypothetical protein
MGSMGWPILAIREINLALTVSGLVFVVSCSLRELDLVRRADSPDLKGTDVGGNTTGSAERLSAPGTGEGAAESQELMLCPSEPESLANFTLMTFLDPNFRRSSLSLLAVESKT